LALFALAAVAGCKHSAPPAAGLKATAAGSAIVESSGGHQVGVTGTVLKDPLVVQVNDDQGTAVPGALVEFHGSAGVAFDPAVMLTDSSGQATTLVTLGSIAGRYQLSAVTPGKSKPVSLDIVETALGYQQRVGSILADKYCNRCHDSESSPERVSNYDNLEVKAACIHRRLHVEQDERCRSHIDHSSRRPGAESLSTHASLRKYIEPCGCAGPYRLHSRGG
jgi:hypothetical protein